MQKLNPDLQDALSKFLTTDYDKIDNEADANVAINELTKLHSQIAGAIENDLADLAVKFQIGVYIGDYGNGRSVQLEEDEYSGYEIGDWVPSSARC